MGVLVQERVRTALCYGGGDPHDYPLLPSPSPRATSPASSSPPSSFVVLPTVRAYLSNVDSIRPLFSIFQTAFPESSIQRRALVSDLDVSTETVHTIPEHSQWLRLM
jgi:hypothetical protein